MVLICIFMILAYYLLNIKKILDGDFYLLKSFLISNIIFISATIFIFIFSDKIEIPYIGNLSKLTSLLELIQTNFKNTAYGRTAYTDFLYPENYYYLFILTPIRIINFFCGPISFNSPKDLLGALDSFFYLYMLSVLIFNLKNTETSKHYLSFNNNCSNYYNFCWGINNYGNSIRHKVKFLPFIILIISPYLYLNLKYLYDFSLKFLK